MGQNIAENRFHETERENEIAQQKASRREQRNSQLKFQLNLDITKCFVCNVMKTKAPKKLLRKKENCGNQRSNGYKTGTPNDHVTMLIQPEDRVSAGTLRLYQKLVVNSNFVPLCKNHSNAYGKQAAEMFLKGKEPADS